MPKVFDHVFGPDSTDWCFLFPTNDTTIAPNEIKCHRKLLSALSPVFANIALTLCADISKVVFIVDESFEDFGTFLAYFYKGEVKLNNNNIDKVYYLAHAYEVDDLSEECITFMTERLAIENIFQYYALAIRTNEANLKLNCENLIALNTELLIQIERFLECKKNTLKEILKLTNISCMEIDLFNACMRWARRKCQKKANIEPDLSVMRNELGECFALIRFKEMDRKAFAGIFKDMSSLFPKDESDDIFMHFMVTNGPATDIRYRKTIIKNGKRSFEDDELFSTRNTRKRTKLSCSPRDD